MTALPMVIFDMGEATITRGTLIDCPAEFFSPNQLRFYQSTSLGWSRCPLGYDTYAALDALGRRLVIPGIISPQQPSPNRKFPNHKLRFERNQIEAFTDPYRQLSEEIKTQRNREFKNLTHDLRAISTEIYHTSLTIKESLEQQGNRALADAAGSVLAAQQMMSVRLDIVDYETGFSAGRPKEKVPVFKKVQKVYRCFWNKMEHRHIAHRMDGASFGYTYGPPILEIAPFVVMENAIKYSPANSNIVIRIEENSEDMIVRFESIGPKIKDSEIDKIFEPNFRGAAAASTDRTGSGIGLYAAKTVVEQHFGGKIFVNQFDQTGLYDRVPFFQTRFTIVLPRVSERETRRVVSRR